MEQMLLFSVLNDISHFDHWSAFSGLSHVVLGFSRRNIFSPVAFTPISLYKLDYTTAVEQPLP